MSERERPRRPARASVFPGFGDLGVTQDGLIAQLVAARRRLGLSQTEVAARMGTSQSAVARLEAGGADARVSTLARYADALGRRLAWRLDDHEEGRDDPT
ncbi:MAG TPA: helix-turn-helix transcriptional regulator [Actinomycetes bacterium]|nr:helix-turn-helix transcriptional regulator [Actinomycetes bacterium]